MDFYTTFALRGNRFYRTGYKDGIKYAVTDRVKEYDLYTTTQNEKLALTPYKSIDGIPLSKLTFPDQFALKKFVKENKSIFKFYGVGRPEYVEIHKRYPGAYGVEYDSSLVRTVFIDIETETEGGYSSVDNPFQRIDAISVVYRDTIFALGLGEYKPTSPNIRYLHCKTEEELLISFFKLMRKIDADVISGWNCERYDLPMLINRSKLVFGDDSQAKKLSPFGIIESRTVTSKYGEEQVYDIVGVATLDYYPLYKKLQLTKLPDNKLHTVAMYELGEGKVDLGAAGLGVSKSNWQLYTDYNIKDSLLVKQIDDKRKYIDLVSRIAMRSKTNYIDAYSQVRLWEQIIYTYLETEQKVQPPMKTYGGSDEDTAFEGAYVKAPITGKHEWVSYYDFTSLYPHVILQFNISPETLIQDSKDITVQDVVKLNESVINSQELIENDVCLAGNGAMFRNDIEGFIPTIIQKMFYERKAAKDTMLKFDKGANMIKNELKKRGVAYA